MAAAIVACNKETAIQTADQSAEKTDGIMITATLAPKEDATKAIAVSGSTLKTTRVKNETLAILYGNKKSATATIKSVNGNTGAATISFTVDAGTANNTACTIIYPADAAKADKSGVKDAKDYLAAQNGALSAKLDVRVGAGTIQTTTPGLKVTTQPTPQYAIFKFTTKNSAGTNISVSKLSVYIEGNEYVITPASATNTLTVALPPVSSKQVSFMATVGSEIYSCAKSVTFAAAKYYQSNLKMVAGGMFSVSAGKQVHFAKGNLTVSNDKFAFLENSWTYNTAAQTDNKVNKVNGSQHFNWGVVFKSASSGESAVVDAITTDLGAGWRGLSKAEWRYLLGYDNGAIAEGSKRTVQWHHYAKIKGASIGTDDKRYLLIFPDAFKESEWTSAMGTKPTNFDNTTDNDIAYTVANFTAMQNAGIVILPAAGYRDGSSWYNVGINGNYWSSTAYLTSYAYYLHFYSSDVRVSYVTKSNSYFSVRLVQNVE